MTDIQVLKLKTGEAITCFVECETVTHYIVSNMMELRLIEYHDMQGLGFVPMLPFDDGEEITIRKDDVLFTYEPPKIIKDLFYDKLGETETTNSIFIARYYQTKKQKQQMLN